MKKLYHLTMYKVKYKLWYIWHCQWRWFFDGGMFRRPVRWLARLVYHRESLWRLKLYCKMDNLAFRLGGCYRSESRPLYHMCCNGNAGGWRTKLCDSLEDYQTGYRYHEEQLYKLGVFK